MNKTIIEIKFNQNFDLKFSEKCLEFLNMMKNVAKTKNINDICFVYFYTGKNEDYLSAYQYIKYLENYFKVNINFIDISFFFEELQKKYKNNNFFKFKDSDINEIIEKIKEMHVKIINDYLKGDIKNNEI